MFDIPCVIFAGGKSSRMGEDKALLPFGDSKTLTEFQLKRLQKIFKNVYISCKSKEKFGKIDDAKFIYDAKSDDIYAPTTGFIAIFETLQEESFFALSVDAPFVGKQEIEKLLDADSPEVDATIAKTKFGIQPMCGIYHRSLKNKFIMMLKQNNHKLRYLLKNSKTNYINFEDEKSFLNLNEQEEYKTALKQYNS